MFAAFQIDPLSGLSPATDTSLRLMLEGQERGYRLFTYQPQSLALHGSEVRAFGSWTKITSLDPYEYHLEPPVWQSLHEAAVVWMRQDPPFDMTYLTATYILDHLWRDVLVVNNPASVRTFPEKLLPHRFPELMPPSVITSSVPMILDLVHQHGTAVLKPLYSYGGRGVIKVSDATSNLAPMITDFLVEHPPAIQVQEFLPGVYKNEKRILLVKGSPVAWFRREPPAGSFIANTAQGGQPHPCDLTAEDYHICDTLNGFLNNHGLIFCGIDVIDGKLMEVNVTSPTGVAIANTLYGTRIEQNIWDALAL
jgi:glutathione synthase